MKQEVGNFLDAFLQNRVINREFYEKVPEEKFDFRMTPHSDTPRESLIHQIDTERDYINGIKTGVLKFRQDYPDLKEANKWTKNLLLTKLKETDKELQQLLADSNFHFPPWLWGLNNHEILHTGWNLALMDHLEISRFPRLKKMWG